MQRRGRGRTASPSASESRESTRRRSPRWRAEAASRTLYVFDVRTPEEYAAGHIPGMKNVPGGQLVQETDRHAATWGARVVLVDDDGVRAVMTAHWMKQMGWDAAALTVDMRRGGHGDRRMDPAVARARRRGRPDDRRRLAAEDACRPAASA